MGACGDLAHDKQKASALKYTKLSKGSCCAVYLSCASTELCLRVWGLQDMPPGIKSQWNRYLTNRLLVNKVINKNEENTVMQKLSTIKKRIQLKKSRYAVSTFSIPNLNLKPQHTYIGSLLMVKASCGWRVQQWVIELDGFQRSGWKDWCTGWEPATRQN